MSNPNLAQEGINYRFSSTRQPKNTGRKPSKLKKFIKEYNVSSEDINIIFTNLLFNYSLDELKEIYKEFSNKTDKVNNLPAGVAAFISGIIHDVGRGDMRAITLILDRVYGKPVQNIDMKTSGQMELTSMAPEERQKYIEELMQKALKNDPTDRRIKTD
jgi:hypothetical protein